MDVQLDIQYNLFIRDIEVWFQQARYVYYLLNSGTFIQYNLMTAVSVENFLSLLKMGGRGGGGGTDRGWWRIFWFVN